MTDATHRIEVRHDPHSKTWPFDAYVYRLSDEHLLHISHGENAADAHEQACEWIRQENLRVEGAVTFWTDDAGNIAQPPDAPVQA